MKYLILILITISLYSCTTYKKCKQKYGSGTETISVQHVYSAVLSADSVKENFPIQQIYSLPVGAVLEARGDKVSAKLKRESETAYSLQALRDTIRIRDTIRVPCPQVQHFKPEPKSFKIGWEWKLILILVSFVLLFFLFRNEKY